MTDIVKRLRKLQCETEYDAATCDLAAAEIERLRGFEAANRLNAAQVKAQRAEVERLRAVLSQLARYSADEDEMDWADTVLEMNAIARAALEK